MDGFMEWCHTFSTRIMTGVAEEICQAFELPNVTVKESQHSASVDMLLDGCEQEPKHKAAALKGKLPPEYMPFFERKLKPYIPRVSNAFPTSHILRSGRLQRRNSDSSKAAKSVISPNNEAEDLYPYVIPNGWKNKGAPIINRSSKPTYVKEALHDIAKLSRNIKACKDDGEESTVNNLIQEIKILKKTGRNIKPARSVPVVRRNKSKKVNLNELCLPFSLTLPPMGLEVLYQEHVADVKPPSPAKELTNKMLDTKVSTQTEANPAISLTPSMTKTVSSPDLVQLYDTVTPPPMAPSVDHTTKFSEVELARPTPTGLPYVLCGLMNEGNTCYMSACIQCLTIIPQFMDYFLYGKYQNDLPDGDSSLQLTRPFIKLLLAMEKSITSVSPFHFKAAVGFSLTKYGNKGQHDSHEFLMDFLKVIHEELRHSTSQVQFVQLTSYDSPPQLAKQYWVNFMNTESSIIYRNMAILMFSPVECQCGAISSTFSHDLSWSLPVPGKGPVNIQCCLDMYIATEVISDYQCEKCGGKVGNKAKKYIMPWRLPRVLLLHFNRFCNNLKKNNTNILFPMLLDLQNFVHTNGRNTKYELCGVVNHFGTLVNGHYTVYLRNICTYEWTCNNDYDVYQMDEENINGNNAYMLMYELVE